jgi:hypothetical protein
MGHKRREQRKKRGRIERKQEEQNGGKKTDVRHVIGVSDSEGDYSYCVFLGL